MKYKRVFCLYIQVETAGNECISSQTVPKRSCSDVTAVAVEGHFRHTSQYICRRSSENYLCIALNAKARCVDLRVCVCVCVLMRMRCRAVPVCACSLHTSVVCCLGVLCLMTGVYSQLLPSRTHVIIKVPSLTHLPAHYWRQYIDHLLGKSEL